jgi:hypothetical protein
MSDVWLPDSAISHARHRSCLVCLRFVAEVIRAVPAFELAILRAIFQSKGPKA